jgi:hypothetical protein
VGASQSLRLVSTNAFYGYDGTIQVNGNTLVNGHGTTVQLRGINFLYFAGAMIFAFNKLSPSNVPDASYGLGVNDQAGTDNGLSGASALVTQLGPNLNYLDPWKMNACRIGLNEASWLSYTSYNSAGTAINANNFGAFTNLSYLNQLDYQIAQCHAHKLYVILTLAFTNPGRVAPFGQDLMANQDNSIALWLAVAARYGYPNGTALKRNGGTLDNRAIIFEMYNEPIFPDQPVYQGGFQNRAFQFSGGGTGGVGGNGYAFPVNTPTGSFTPGEGFTASNGTAGNIICYYLNTTTGYDSSGTKFLHTWNLSGTNISGGAPTSGIPMPVGTTITGSTSGATATITATVYPGQGTAGTYGFYFAGAVQLVAAIRAAGAGNVCLFSGSNYAHDLTNWGTYGAGTDTTPPAGWVSGGFGTWTSQIAAHWHPYPVVSAITGIAIASGGSGYAVNDTILLPMDESGGSQSGSCYWQPQLQVSSIGGGGAITGVTVNAYTGGTPGVSGGNAAEYSGFKNMVGGIYCDIPNQLPVNPVGQASSSGSGTGATFNLTLTFRDGLTANYANWNNALTYTAGYPLVIDETGEHTAASGIQGSPWMQNLTAWADLNGVSFVPFYWSPNNAFNYNAKGCDFLICNSTLTGSPQYRSPSPGYGQFMFTWYTSHAP